MPKSTLAKAKFVIGSSRGSRSAHTLLLEMAQDAEKLAAQGKRIKRFREAMRTDEGKRVTQPVVAEAVGVTPRAYQEWEAGRGDMKPENVKALADYFETTPDYIEYGTNAPARGGTPALMEDLTDEPSWLPRIEGKLDMVIRLLQGSQAEESAEDAEILGDVVAGLGDADESPQTTASDQPATRPAARPRKSA